MMGYNSAQILKSSIIFENDWLTLYKQITTSNSLDSTRNVWEKSLSSDAKKIFFCRTLIETINACLNRNYTLFDAHTTSNCCHGIALIVRNSLLLALQLDLENIRHLSEGKIQELEKNTLSVTHSFLDWVPEPLTILSGLYILATVRDIDINRKIRTEARKLRCISPIGVEFCWVLTNAMKKHFSNLVAHSYEQYLERMELSANINGAPVSLWGEYVKKGLIRKDKRGICYVSCVFSAQLSLAYLISIQAKIAIVNDVIDSAGAFRYRYVRILEGDGYESFRILPSNDANLKLLDQDEPLVVFGGYVYSDSLTEEFLSKKIEPWLDHFPRLLLACDMCYPQFPAVRDDPEFDNTPIIPKHDQLRKVCLQHSGIRGVSASDPSLYCSSHIYTASVSQVVESTKKGEFGLPTCYHGLQISENEMWGKTMLQLKTQTV